MLTSLVPVGFGNYVSMEKVVAISPYLSSSVIRLVRELRALGRVIDFTAKRSIKSVFFLTSGKVILTALNPETITRRIEK